MQTKININIQLNLSYPYIVNENNVRQQLKEKLYSLLIDPELQFIPISELNDHKELIEHIPNIISKRKIDIEII